MVRGVGGRDMLDLGWAVTMDRNVALLGNTQILGIDLLLCTESITSALGSPRCS